MSDRTPLDYADHDAPAPSSAPGDRQEFFTHAAIVIGAVAFSFGLCVTALLLYVRICG